MGTKSKQHFNSSFFEILIFLLFVIIYFLGINAIHPFGEKIELGNGNTLSRPNKFILTVIYPMVYLEKLANANIGSVLPSDLRVINFIAKIIVILYIYLLSMLLVITFLYLKKKMIVFFNKGWKFWLAQPLILIVLWTLLCGILFKTELFFICFLLTPSIIMLLGAWEISLGISMLKEKKSKFFGVTRTILGIILLLLSIIAIQGLFVGEIDLFSGEYCGQTASGFGTCGYMGPVKDCDCLGIKYYSHPLVYDVGLNIKCKGKAYNFRDVPLPWNICSADPEYRCKLLGKDACKEPAINKTVLDKFPKKGSDNSKIVIIEFGDVTDYHSFKFFNETFPLLEKEYINQGIVQFFWINIPYEDSVNPGDKRTIEAAEALKCAQEQGRFWEMQNKLFQNQNNLTFEKYKSENYVTWASEIGLNEAEFKICLQSEKYEEEVMAEKRSIRFVQDTPSFYINHQYLEGTRTFEEFKSEIEGQLTEYYSQNSSN